MFEQAKISQLNTLYTFCSSLLTRPWPMSNDEKKKIKENLVMAVKLLR
jgi:hypothetical protein